MPKTKPHTKKLKLSGRFSIQLAEWLTESKTKTIDDLISFFGPRSISLLIVLLMFIPSLPLPTGGFSHVLSIIAMLLSLEMLFGRTKVWLPRAWRAKSMGEYFSSKTLPLMMRRIAWLEKYSRRRHPTIFQRDDFRRLSGLILFIFCAFATFAPPFTTLDTLPSLGAVIMGLSFILSDMVLWLGGLIIGSTGIVLIFTVGEAIRRLLVYLLT